MLVTHQPLPPPRQRYLLLAVCALALDLGAPGAWFGAAVENNVRGLLIYLRFRSGKWKQRHV